MKKNVLLSSIATIALCLCLIAGSTFALFTSRSEVNIAVTAGKVEMLAGVAITSVESVEKATAGATDVVVDENGAEYAWSYSDTTAPYNFINGGTAVVNGAVLTVDKITPGDRINLSVSGTNNSDVAIQYRYIVECVDGYKLMDGLKITVGGATYSSLASYTSVWAPLAANTDMPVENITIELPVSAGNEYQEKTTSIKVIVEAVQGNGVVEDNTTPVVVNIPKVTNETELEDALKNPAIPAINILEDVAGTFTVDYDLSNKTILVNGNDASFAFSGKLENVVVDGIVDNGDATPAVTLNGATGDITIMNSVMTDHNSLPYGAVAGGNADLSVTIKNCELSGARPVYNAGPVKSLTIVDSKITDTSSWAVLMNAEVYGDIVIDNCTFVNCVGLFKATRAVSGDFTFTNNEIIDCVTKNGFYVDAKVDGEVTVSGNTMTFAGVVVDADVTVADLLGLVKN